MCLSKHLEWIVSFDGIHLIAYGVSNVSGWPPHICVDMDGFKTSEELQDLSFIKFI